MDIDTVARLARIKLDPAECERYAKELEGVLALIETMGELDLSDVPPTRHVVPIETPLRADHVGPTLSLADTLSNAPLDDGEAFVVPKVV